MRKKTGANRHAIIRSKLFHLRELLKTHRALAITPGKR
jgi:hypothetical protein